VTPCSLIDGTSYLKKPAAGFSKLLVPVY